MHAFHFVRLLLFPALFVVCDFFLLTISFCFLHVNNDCIIAGKSILYVRTCVSRACIVTSRYVCVKLLTISVVNDDDDDDGGGFLFSLFSVCK